MSVFVCDECNNLENTALGHFWGRDVITFADITKNGKALCSACTPTHYSDGSTTGMGKWHGKHKQIKWDGKKQVINR